VAAAFVAIGLLIPNFLQPGNILNVIRQSSIISLCAYGMTMVIIIKGIDLAVSGIMSCCAMIGGLLMLRGVPVPFAILAGLAAGTLMGAFNGMMVQKLEVPAFITTLVVGQVANGLALVLNSGRSIGGFPSGYVFIGNGSFLGIPISNYITIVFVVFCTILMARTRLGVHIYALGGNDTVVKQQGISSAKINYFVFSFSGFCAATAGILLSAQLDTVHPTQGGNYVLDAVAACVIGGVSMAGGEGKIYMALAGALVIGFLRNALNLLGMHPFYQNIIVGVIIILIVAMSIAKRQKELERGRVF
jgi:ribose/xylose/arabinose/galactoside ABC-type transport system permease subunit